MDTLKELMSKTDNLSDEDLWQFYGFIGAELKNRNLVRTRNIVGERGEFLVIKTYNTTPGLPNLQAAPEGTQNVDAISRKGERYSIKTMTEPSNLTGVFYGLGSPDDREIPEKKFEYITVVVIDKNYTLKKMIELNWEQFLKYRRWHTTMRAWNISITKNLLENAKTIFNVKT